MAAALESAFAGVERGRAAEAAGDLVTATSEFALSVELFQRAVPYVRAVEPRSAELILSEATSLAARVARLRSRISRRDRARTKPPRQTRVMVTVEDFSESEPTLFLVSVAFDGAHRWSIAKRFSDFRSLDAALRKILTYRYTSRAPAMPSLPRRHSLLPAGFSRQKFLAGRCSDLSRYAAAVANVADVQDVLQQLVRGGDAAASRGRARRGSAVHSDTWSASLRQWFDPGSSTMLGLIDAPLFVVSNAGKLIDDAPRRGVAAAPPSYARGLRFAQHVVARVAARGRGGGGARGPTAQTRAHGDARAAATRDRTVEFRFRRERALSTRWCAPIASRQEARFALEDAVRLLAAGRTRPLADTERAHGCSRCGSEFRFLHRKPHSCRLCGDFFCNSCAPKTSFAPWADGFAAVADGFALLPRATLPRLGEGLLANALSGEDFLSRLLQGSSGAGAGAGWHGDGAGQERAAHRAEFVARLRATTARVCAQVSLFCTVTFRAKTSHNLTHSP